MATTQAQRAALFNTLTELMGQDDAETLTEQLPPSGWDSMATKDDIKVLGTTLTAGLAEVNATMAVGFAHAAEERAKIITAVTTAMAAGFAHATEERAKIATTMAAGFAHATEERAKIITAVTTAMAAGFAHATEERAKIATAMAAGFAHATEERAKIITSQARHLYVTVATIVVAAASIWIALFVAPVAS